TSRSSRSSTRRYAFARQTRPKRISRSATSLDPLSASPVTRASIAGCSCIPLLSEARCRRTLVPQGSTGSLMVRRALGGYVVGMAGGALGGTGASAGAPWVGDGPSRGHPQVRVHPRVVRRGQAAVIGVTGIDVPSLEVLVAGGTSVVGAPLRWRPLRLWHGA